MTYNLLFYAVIAVVFLVGMYSMFVLKKGGSVFLAPINGVGLIWQYTKIWVATNEDGSHGFFDTKITVGLLFIFLVFQWQDGFKGDPQDFDDENRLNYGY